MSARITALEANQAEFRTQLNEFLMSRESSEQPLKSIDVRLDNLATMVTSIISRLESKPTCSQPDDNGGKHNDITPTPPKSPCENQGQSIPARIGTSPVHTVDVLDVSYVPSEEDNPPKQAVRMTRSKDVKVKGVGIATGNSEVGLKTGRSPKVVRKKKPTRGGGSKVSAAQDGSVQNLHEGGAAQEGQVNPGEDLAIGAATLKSTIGGSEEEAHSGSGGVQPGPQPGETRHSAGLGDSGEAVSGGVGSVQEGRGQGHKEGSVVVEAGEAQVVAVNSTAAQSPGRGTSAFSVHVRSKTMSPGKLGGNGVQSNATGNEVSPQKWSPLKSIPAGHNPPKLLIFNVHGTLLDTSLLSQPNPNTHIRITKKTKTRRYVFRPWMMEFLGRCFRNFKVAFWGLKSSEYMEEVLSEILPVFEHNAGQKPVFSWSSKDCEPIHVSEDCTTWGKPLRKVWDMWPCWNATNTLIVDHHGPRVDCNPQANVIVPPPFYVANMKDVAEDNEYLKMKLWPALEAWCPNEDVPLAPRRPCTPPADPRLQSFGGEGCCGLGGDNRHCPLTCNS